MPAYGSGAPPTCRTTVLPKPRLRARALAALTFIICVPLSAAGAPERRSASAEPTAWAAPAEGSGDRDRAALETQKLRAEIAELEARARVPWSSHATAISAVVGVLAGLAGLWRLYADARKERAKRDDDRFQAVVSGFGSDNNRAWIGAAVVLRTFFQPGYERFYRQAFDIVIAYLKVVDGRSEGALEHTLVTAFREGFPRARNELQKTRGLSTADELGVELDASDVRLDGAFLWKADLRNIWMPRASLHGTDLCEADLGGARLWGAKANLRPIELRQADLSDADLGCAELPNAELSQAKLCRARLWAATLTHARLWGADLTHAQLYKDENSGANLAGATLCNATLCNAKLREVNLEGADLRGADLRGADLQGAKLEGAKYNSRKTQLQHGDELITLEPTRWPGAAPPGAHDTTP